MKRLRSRYMIAPTCAYTLHFRALRETLLAVPMNTERLCVWFNGPAANVIAPAKLCVLGIRCVYKYNVTR